MFGISAERIAKIDEDATRGILPGTVVNTITGRGRKPLFAEPMTTVTFKDEVQTVKLMDIRAEQPGIKRSDYLRQLVANDLTCAGLYQKA